MRRLLLLLAFVLFTGCQRSVDAPLPVPQVVSSSSSSSVVRLDVSDEMLLLTPPGGASGTMTGVTVTPPTVVPVGSDLSSAMSGDSSVSSLSSSLVSAPAGETSSMGMMPSSASQVAVTSSASSVVDASSSSISSLTSIITPRNANNDAAGRLLLGIQVDRSEVRPEGVIQVSLPVRNLAPVTATGFVIEARFPDGVTVVDAQLGSSSGRLIQWSFNQLPPREMYVVHFALRMPKKTGPVRIQGLMRGGNLEGAAMSTVDVFVHEDAPAQTVDGPR